MSFTRADTARSNSAATAVATRPSSMLFSSVCGLHDNGRVKKKTAVCVVQLYIFFFCRNVYKLCLTVPTPPPPPSLPIPLQCFSAASVGDRNINALENRLFVLFRVVAFLGGEGGESGRALHINQSQTIYIQRNKGHTRTKNNSHHTH